MNSDSESNDEITDEQLDALLRDVTMPGDLKQRLLAVTDVEPAALRREKSRSKGLPWKRVLAAAASLAGIALFSLWAFSGGSQRANPKVATNKTPPKSVETTAEVDQLLAEFKQLSDELDSLQTESKLNRIDQLLAEASPRQRSLLPDEELISTVLAIAEQTPVILGASPESTIKDMEKIVEKWPGTRGAVIAQEFIDQSEPNQKDKS